MSNRKYNEILNRVPWKKEWYWLETMLLAYHVLSNMFLIQNILKYIFVSRKEKKFNFSQFQIEQSLNRNSQQSL